MAPDSTGIICLPPISQRKTPHTKGNRCGATDRSRSFPPLKVRRRSGSSENTRLPFQGQRERVCSTPAFTGQFNERPNTTSPLTFSSRPPPPPVPESSCSHEINVEPAVLDQSTDACDGPSSPRLHVLERMSARQGFGDVHTVSCPSIQTFPNARKSYRRFLSCQRSPLRLASSDLMCGHLAALKLLHTSRASLFPAHNTKASDPTASVSPFS